MLPVPRYVLWSYVVVRFVNLLVDSILHPLLYTLDVKYGITALATPYLRANKNKYTWFT